MKPVTYFRRWGFSINEGGGPVNFHMSWRNKLFLVYLYAWGRRFSWSYNWRDPNEKVIPNARPH